MASIQKRRTGLCGVIAAVPTPVTDTGRPDPDAFLTHARWALANGCDGLNVLGTTGEATSFSRNERKRLMSAAAQSLGGERLMVGTGTPDLETTIDLTRTAHHLGFAGALVLPPFYYKGVSDEGLIAWFEGLVDGTADAPVPLYLYNFPQMTGIPFPPGLVGRLKAAFPDRLAGAKDSSGDLDYAAQLARIDDFDVFPSNEAALARVPLDGYAGIISATVNITAPLAALLWATPRDEAVASQLSAARGAITAQPLIPAIKHLTARLHGIDGFEPVLPPLAPLDAAQKAALAGFTHAA